MLAHLKSYPRDLRPVRFNMWSHQGNEKPWSEYSFGWLKDKETKTMTSEKWPQRLMTSWSPLKMDNSHSDPQFKSDRDRWHKVSVKKECGWEKPKQPNLDRKILFSQNNLKTYNYCEIFCVWWEFVPEIFPSGNWSILEDCYHSE